MPEGKKAVPPPEDPHHLLGRLDQVVQRSKAPGGGGRTWTRAVLIVLAVIVAASVWSWVGYFRNRKLGRLRHEKNKAKILLEKERVQRKLAEGEAEIRIVERRLEVLRNKSRIIDADIEAEVARYEADLRAIDRISSWTDAGPSVRK